MMKESAEKQPSPFGNLPPTVGRLTLLKRVRYTVECACSCKRAHITLSVAFLQRCDRGSIDIGCGLCMAEKKPQRRKPQPKRERYTTPLTSTHYRGTL